MTDNLQNKKQISNLHNEKAKIIRKLYIKSKRILPENLV